MRTNHRRYIVAETQAGQTLISGRWCEATALRKASELVKSGAAITAKVFPRDYERNKPIPKGAYCEI